MSRGDTLEIYKEVGLPKDVAARFEIEQMSGTHGIGHTRMATESAVTTMGAHPFNTGNDQCLVHNGSLSNHASPAPQAAPRGYSHRDRKRHRSRCRLSHMANAKRRDAGRGLESSLDDLDGFFTFVVGTKDGFGVVRDPIACKPAVMAETDQYVAFGSEYRALVDLPGIETPASGNRSPPPSISGATLISQPRESRLNANIRYGADRSARAECRPCMRRPRTPTRPRGKSSTQRRTCDCLWVWTPRSRSR